MPDITDMADWVSERRIPQPADGEPAITMFMDNGQIIFRDQAALDGYVAGVLAETANEMRDDLQISEFDGAVLWLKTRAERYLRDGRRDDEA